MKDRVTSGIPRQYGDWTMRLAEERRDVHDVELAMNHPDAKRLHHEFIDEMARQMKALANKDAILNREAFMAIGMAKYEAMGDDDLRALLLKNKDRIGDWRIVELMQIFPHNGDYELVEFTASEMGFNSKFSRQQMWDACELLGIRTMDATHAILGWLEMDPSILERYYFLMHHVNMQEYISHTKIIWHTAHRNDGQHLFLICGGDDDKHHTPDEVWVYCRSCK